MIQNLRLKILLCILVLSIVGNIFVVYQRFFDQKEDRIVDQESKGVEGAVVPTLDSGLVKKVAREDGFELTPFDKGNTSFVISINDNKRNKIWYYAWNYHTNSSQLIHVLDHKEGGYKLLRPFSDGTWLAVRIPPNSQYYTSYGNDLYRVDLNQLAGANFLVGSPRAMIVDAVPTSNDNIYFLDSDEVDGFTGDLYKFDTSLKKLEMVGQPDGGIYTMYSLVGEGRKDWEIGLRMNAGDGAGYINGFYIANAMKHTIDTVGEYGGFDGVGESLLAISPELDSAIVLRSVRESDAYDADVVESIYAVFVEDNFVATTSLWAKGFGPEHKNSKVRDASVRYWVYTVLLDNGDGTVSLLKYDSTTKYGDQIILDHKQCPGYCYLVPESIHSGFDIIGSPNEQEKIDFYFPRDGELEKVALPTGLFPESSYKFIPIY